jgi:ABC-type Na+ efflux pump permease subunit
LIRETWGRLARAPEPDAPLRPPVSDRPLLWKELYAAGRGLPEVQQALSVIEMVAVSFGAALAALVLVADWDGGAHASGPIAVMGSVLLGLRTAGIGLAAAQSISRERQRGTLDLLLVMPCDRREILAAKWHGALGALWPATVALAGFVGLCLLAGMLPLGGALLLGIAAIVHAALAANVGLCVSIGCRTTVSAGMTGLVALAGVAFGPWLAWRALALLGLPIYRPELTSLIDAGLTPPLTWYYLLSSAPWNWLLPVVVPGLAMQALAAAGLWLLARRWFERQEV